MSTVTIANTALRIALALRGIGLAQKFLWSPLETETSIFAVLFFELDLPETTSLAIDNLCVWIYLLTGMALVAAVVTSNCCSSRASVRPWSETTLFALRQLALGFCVAWETVLVAAIIARDDAFQSHWTPATHALRFSVPLALLLSSSGPNVRLSSSVTTLLRVAIAATFIGHGMNAWLQNPEYTTFILATTENLFHTTIHQSTAESILRIIALLDFLAGVGLIWVRSKWNVYRWLIVYLACWGFLTAASRMTAGGLEVWHETLLRASHFLGPVVLFAELVCPTFECLRYSDRGIINTLDS